MLSRVFDVWEQALAIVQPATVIGWHRAGLKRLWTRRSRAGKPGRPLLDHGIRDLIRKMSRANPMWGSPRMRNELVKLGIELSRATVAKYMIRHRKPRRWSVGRSHDALRTLAEHYEPFRTGGWKRPGGETHGGGTAPGSGRRARRLRQTRGNERAIGPLGLRRACAACCEARGWRSRVEFMAWTDTNVWKVMHFS
jgi:hypothetical protein